MHAHSHETQKSRKKKVKKQDKQQTKKTKEDAIFMQWKASKNEG